MLKLLQEAIYCELQRFWNELAGKLYPTVTPLYFDLIKLGGQVMTLILRKGSFS